MDETFRADWIYCVRERVRYDIIHSIVLKLPGCGENVSRGMTGLCSGRYIEFWKTGRTNMDGVIRLGKYKGLNIKRPVIEVTDEQKEAYYLHRQRQFATSVAVERPVERGDVVNIDFVGKLNGEPFEGGSSEGYLLEVGSGAFIPGFEEQMIGAKIGETRDLLVQFPEDYPERNMAGRPAVFTVKINSVSEQQYPPLTNSVKREIDDSLEMFAEQEMEQQFEDLIAEALVADSEIEVPEDVLAVELDESYEQWKAQILMQGVELEQYLTMSGMTEEDVRNELKEKALYRASSRLALEAVAEAEGLKATKAAMTMFLSQMATQYGVPLETLEESLPKEHLGALESDVRIRKAFQFIKDNMVEE